MNTIEKIKEQLELWPIDAQYIFERTMAEHGWDELTAFVMIMFGHIACPAINLTPEQLEKIKLFPARIKIKWNNT